jgi:two-component system chemotaxis sensor kinase CheA
MDMSKYRGLFLSESREHLGHMSQLAIKLEQNPSDRDGIDAMFREAHSIKGMAASMGFELTAELAHHLEDLMDGFRKTGTVPSSAVDRLLEGIDLLEGLIADIDAGAAERSIAAFIAAETAPDDPASGQSPLPVTPAAPPEAVVREPAVMEPSGQTLQVNVELADDAVAPSARAMLILETLRGFGRIEACKPTIDELKQGVSLHQLSFWLNSPGERSEITAALKGMPDVARITFQEDRRQEPRSEEDMRTVRVRTTLLDRLINLTGELISTRYGLQGAARSEDWREIRGGIDQLTRLVTDLHYHVLQVRMMPLESVTATLPRIVRDLCRKTGKQISLQISGTELELDRAILEDLADPLVHMVRNAIDHGIDRQGTIVIRAWREKDLALISVGDDGRGIDPQAIRRKLLDRGLLTVAQIDALSERELLQWICHPGFSTRDTVSETSGRGVGMDVVKSALEGLGGLLEIDSQPGKGTRFLLKVPLSVAIIKILLVACSGNLLGIPITRVLRTLDIESKSIQSSGGQAMIPLAGEALPLYALNTLLGLPDLTAEGPVHLVVCESQGRRVGLIVDSLAGQREAFIKPLSPPLNHLPGVSGATVMGDGHIVFIVDPQALFGSDGLRLQEHEEDA